MDSGNSGSLHSSSCSEEVHDSHSDSISALIHHPSATAHVGSGSVSNHPSQVNTHTTTTIFDPLTSYFLHNNNNEHISRPPLLVQDLQNTTFTNNTTAWPKMTVRSDSLSSSAQRRTDNPHNLGITPQRDSPKPSDQAHVRAAPNPRKRSRASRRAPTTVLTTDTCNFRAMVQEFTGIPAAPPLFSSSLSFSSARNRLLDLFGTVDPFDSSTKQPYLHRPFPQKIQPTPSSVAVDASVEDALGLMSSTNNDMITASSALDILQPAAITSNHIFNTQKINHMPLLDTAGCSNDHVNVNANFLGLPDLIPSDHLRSRNDVNPAGSDEGGQSHARFINDKYASDFLNNGAN